MPMPSRYIEIISSPISSRYVSKGKTGLIVGNSIRVAGVWFDYNKEEWVVKDTKDRNLEEINRIFEQCTNKKHGKVN